MIDREPNVTNNFVQEVLTDFPAIVETKDGYKTTEFWITLVGVLGTQVGALDLPGEHAKTIATIALAVAYVLSRGVAKAGVPTPAPTT